LIDLAVAIAGLTLTAPFLVAIALAIRLHDGDPVFFRQRRLGLDGKTFAIYKFRSMVVNAEQIGAKLRVAKNDARITPVGRILREFHLDEIPQLFNVLRGEMGLVGPRPAVPFQKDFYAAWEMARLSVRPGLTGLSQVSGGNALNWDDRILIDVYFVHKRHLGMFFMILATTFVQLFMKKGIYTTEGCVKGWTRPVPDSYFEETDTSRASSSQGGE
jgi:lipopolysaccharide/colanic/teichoic acid biosynthesis glycosyltransferase